MLFFSAIAVPILCLPILTTKRYAQFSLGNLSRPGHFYFESSFFSSPHCLLFAILTIYPTVTSALSFSPNCAYPSFPSTLPIRPASTEFKSQSITSCLKDAISFCRSIPLTTGFNEGPRYVNVIFPLLLAALSPRHLPPPPFWLWDEVVLSSFLAGF